jgi:hypothetical protein
MNAKNEMLDLINQARAEARSDNLKRFFSKNSKIISKLFIVLLLAVVAFFVYSSYRKMQAEKFSKILHRSLLSQQAGELDKARLDLEEIYKSDSAPSGVKSLASLRLAAFLLEEGKLNDATKIYQEVNNCRLCDDYVKDLAGLLMIKLWVADALELQKEDLSKKIAEIEDNASVLKFQISEQRAIVEMYKGNLEESYKIFESIEKSSDASQAVKLRAADGIKMLIEKGYTKKDA